MTAVFTRRGASHSIGHAVITLPHCDPPVMRRFLLTAGGLRYTEPATPTACVNSDLSRPAPNSSICPQHAAHQMEPRVSRRRRLNSSAVATHQLKCIFPPKETECSDLQLTSGRQTNQPIYMHICMYMCRPRARPHVPRHTVAPPPLSCVESGCCMWRLRG